MKTKTLLFFGFIIIGFIVLCSLGTWQVSRLEEKQKLIAQIELGFLQEPVALSSVTAGEDLSYRRFFIQGKFIPRSDFFLINRKNEDEWGKELLGILQNGDQSILVNLDWLEKDEDVHVPGARQQYVGYLAPFPKKHMFRPEHKEGDNTLLWIDRDFIEKETGKKLFDWVFYVTENRDPDFKTYHSLNITIPNNHLQYAIFWYAMAGILLVMGFFVWRGQNKK